MQKREIYRERQIEFILDLLKLTLKIPCEILVTNKSLI